jgi:prevent-host-death family protein
MRTFGAVEEGQDFDHLLDILERGEEVMITRHGKEAARIVPVRPHINRDEARLAVQRIRARAEQRKFGPFDWAEWKASRDESRP